MGWASRPPSPYGGQDAHPTILDNLFLGVPLHQNWQLLPRPDRRSLHNFAQIIQSASTTCAVTLSPRVQHLPPHPSQLEEVHNEYRRT
ncbi:hypothetical protein [Nostoc sp.]|uniref:hypothetical protein n=1 Tax=Nostoc sp. TaxID=1180 RepID=UPI002FF5657A